MAMDYERLKKLNLAMAKKLHQEISEKQKNFWDKIYKPEDSLMHLESNIEFQLPLIKKARELIKKVDEIYNESITLLCNMANEKNAANLKEESKNYSEFVHSRLADCNKDISEIKKNNTLLKRGNPVLADFLIKLVWYLEGQIDDLEKIGIEGTETIA